MRAAVPSISRTLSRLYNRIGFRERPRGGLCGVRFAQEQFDHTPGPAAGPEPLGGEVIVRRMIRERS